MTTEWIIVASSIATACGVIFIAWQALSTAKQANAVLMQIHLDHERSRRQAAVELMQYWTVQVQNLLPALHIRPVIEELNIAQCEKLLHGNSLTVDKRFLTGLEVFFSSLSLAPNNPISVNDGFIDLNEFQCSHIRRHIIDYLNVLETVATAWRHNVVDRDIVEEEFSEVFIKNKNTFRLETVLRASTIYPSIKEFVEALTIKANKRSNKNSLDIV
jgi:hypothetical protein